MPTATVRLRCQRGVSGLVGTLAYKVVGPLGTHVARTTAGVAADGVDARNYYVDVEVDTAWAGAEVVWDDGTRSAGEPLAPYQAAIEAGELPTAAEVAQSLLGTGNVAVIGIVTGQTIRIYRGDDYSTEAANRRFRMSKQAGEPWPDDLSEYTIKLHGALVEGHEDYGAEGVAQTFEWDGTVVDATGDDQEIKFSPSGTDTADLAVGQGGGCYEWWAVAEKDGDEATLRSGVMTVLKGRPAA